MELFIQGISIGVMVIIPMLMLIAILFNIVRNHTVAVVTIIWSFLFSFLYITGLFHCSSLKMSSYHIWFELLKEMNLEAWVCLIYYILIFLATLKTMVNIINESRN